MTRLPIPPGRNPGQSWRDLLQRGAASIAYSILHFGGAVADAIRAVGSFFGASWSASQAAVNRVQQAMIAGQTLTTAPAPGSIPTSTIPLSPLMQSVVPGAPQPNIQYRLNVRGEVAGTQEGVWTTLYIESADELTREEVESRARELYAQVASGVTGSPRVRGNVDPSPSVIHIAWVFRSR